MNKKVLYVSTRYPYPKVTGRHKMIAQNLENLVEEFEVSLAYFGQAERIKPEVKLNQVINLKYPSILTLVTNFIFRWKNSLQENLFYSKKTDRSLKDFIEENKFEIIICDMVRTAQFFEHDSGHLKILDLDDLLSIRYLRATTDTSYNLLGTFAFSKSIMFVGKLLNPISKSIMRLEAKKIGKRESSLAESFDSTYLVSPKETEIFKQKIKKPVFCNPPAVRIQDSAYKNVRGDNNLLFLGNFASNQNYQSIEEIINKVMPCLEKSLPEFKIILIGASDGRLEKLIAKNEKLIYLGFVDDLESVLKTIKLALVPIAFGTGIKTKLLDLMSYGIPVVTNQVGAEGLQNNREFVVRDTFEDCAKAAIELIDHPEQLEMLSQKGRVYVESFEFEKVRQTYLGNINDTILQKI